MNRKRIHILYEYGKDLRPFGSAFIRLLRPLTHPTLRDNLAVTTGMRYEGQAADAVIVDRLWRPDISPVLAENLVKDVHRTGAKLIYALDDNLLDLSRQQLTLALQGKVGSIEQYLWMVRFLLRQADGVLVTTEPLRNRFVGLNPRIAVVPNALDERLLVRRLPPTPPPFRSRRKVIGYMGTLTHDDDLKMILPALKAIYKRHPNQVEFQIVGVIGRKDSFGSLNDLPLHVINPRPGETEYPLFMLWFSSRIRWDVGISPLRDTPFNRAKSDIKFLDYSAIGAAGVYSRVPAYDSTVRHLETGWLVENKTEAWIEALETLLSNDELQTKLAQNASRYLHTKRILAQCANNWLKALNYLLGNA